MKPEGETIFAFSGRSRYYLFGCWRNTKVVYRVLSGRDNVEFKLYPNLNHLFVEGEGRSKPAEYRVPGHVAEDVIGDIAQWIKTH